MQFGKTLYSSFHPKSLYFCNIDYIHYVYKINIHIADIKDQSNNINRFPINVRERLHNSFENVCFNVLTPWSESDSLSRKSFMALTDGMTSAT